MQNRCFDDSFVLSNDEDVINRLFSDSFVLQMVKTTEKVHFRAMMCVNLTSGSHYHKQRSTPCHCLSTQEHYTMPLQISI